MKLRNKKTGEIRPAEAREDGIYLYNKTTEQWYKYELDLLAEWWEYYEEPKFGYIIDPMEEDCVSADDSGYEESDVERAKKLGIWFETQEEAEKAVEKLKALTRLEKAGFVLRCGDPIFDYQGDHHESLYGMAEFEVANYEGVEEDLKTIFGGEE